MEEETTQTDLTMYIDFSEVEKHNITCSMRGLYYPSGNICSVQSDIMRYV